MSCRITKVCRHLARWRGACVLLAVLAGPAAGDLPPLRHTMKPVQPPVTAGDFTLPDIDGNAIRLSENRGKVVMINFWATWCPPCRREMPSLQRLYARYRDRGFEVLAINQWESPDLVVEFARRLDVAPTFPVLFDSDSRVAESYAVKGLPTTFLLDREGRIRFQAIGGREFDHPDVEALVESLL